MLLAALFARTQTADFSSISRNVYIKQILNTWFIIFPFSCLQSEEYSQKI